MPQIRKDPLVNRWVIIATERARRPASFNEHQDVTTHKDECPYCLDPKKLLMAIYDGVRVLHSAEPLLDETQPFVQRKHGLYDVCHNFGGHEVIIESDLHIANMADLPLDQIAKVFKAYAKRIDIHRSNPAMEYVMAYKNYGVAAGSRPIGHSRSQIMAVPVNPMRVQDKLSGAKRYYDFHDRCLMCDLIRQEISDKERVISTNEDFIAIAPFAARFPFEVMIVPKFHHHDFAASIVGKENNLASIMKDVLTRFKIGLNDPAYNYMIQTAPLRHTLNIENEYHWHIELIPRLTRVAGFERGTGFYISPIPPEMAAQYLKDCC